MLKIKETRITRTENQMGNSNKEKNNKMQISNKKINTVMDVTRNKGLE